MIFDAYLGFPEKLQTKAATCLEGWSPVHLGVGDQGVFPAHGGQVPILQQRGQPIPLEAITGEPPDTVNHVYNPGLPLLPGADPNGVGFVG